MRENKYIMMRKIVDAIKKWCEQHTVGAGSSDIARIILFGAKSRTYTHQEFNEIRKMSATVANLIWRYGKEHGVKICTVTDAGYNLYMYYPFQDEFKNK